MITIHAFCRHTLDVQVKEALRLRRIRRNREFRRLIMASLLAW